MEPVAGAEAVEAEVAPGVSPAATSSSRWRRLLAAGSSRDTHPDLGEDARARCITFLVDTADVADTGAGIVVELGDVASPASRARIDAALARARTGWRFRVGGDEAALGALRAILHEAGVLDEEIEFVLAAPRQTDAQVTVYCGHCHAKTRTAAAQTSSPADSAQQAALAELVACGGCGIALTVYYHYSRRQGAYLGYFAAAEQGSAEQEPAGQDPAEHPSAGRRPVTRERSELALA
ncbi:dimethylamine monooxygenase subunit DmmA family protein [Pseudoclavibacter sp. AY1H1]|uniref:dimethylamine monooxygenase subunit DmmA family protein n=1 Tax=Pseudoclavibacter sp. AY1H1 TaxID=2080584 RepID=UPI0015E40309|nr:dimethylamine monooxygenase subunit DmmA family protein [Pseudoclavibacter sp. AY1H1]